MRYHWSGIPTAVGAQTYRLRVGGNVNTPLELSLADLKKMADATELVAVNRCSGNLGLRCSATENRVKPLEPPSDIDTGSLD